MEVGNKCKISSKITPAGPKKTQGHGGMECDLNTLHKKATSQSQRHNKLPQ